MDEASAPLRGVATLKTRTANPGTMHGAGRWWVLAAVTIGLLLFLAPFVLAFFNAIKTPDDYAAHGPLAIPQSFDLSALTAFWTNVDFTRKLINSTIISAATAVFAVLLSLLNAYAIGIGRIKGGSKILILLLIGIMIPQESLVYPIYYLSKSVGLFDSLWAVIIVFSVLQSAFGTYLLASVMTTFPREIIEAAEMDGATNWQILWTIVVPVLRPTLSVLATFFFIWTWNEFLLPLVLLASNNNQTVSVSMGVLNGQYVSTPTTTAAAALLGIAPTLIFFLIFQRTLTRGVVVGAIK
ncbi:carbohydrate ABC transporter permease [Devosia algicola]|uniref:sn-glycerol-3-phosphate transport system permease protein UgpE n=1 Tax=Devosia algicola TaxID=3026418 RepID=A0ABY7YM78_9HYPH|nr:carbohydrate ABC transporter permease [Devosia algicola]WDR02396.1 carbohydrate ABC transporter permease [Devosia algicola]